jgi:hypothetical protein
MSGPSMGCCSLAGRWPGLLGPTLVNYLRQYKVTHGVAKAQAYNVTMYVMAGRLIIGFICNVFVSSVHGRFHMRAADADAEVAPVFGRQ